ncbi:MAG: hypothetical protein ACK56I_35255, partial [bacterium]
EVVVEALAQQAFRQTHQGARFRLHPFVFVLEAFDLRRATILVFAQARVLIPLNRPKAIGRTQRPLFRESRAQPPEARTRHARRFNQTTIAFPTKKAVQLSF